MKPPEFRLFRTTAIRLAVKSILFYGFLLLLVLAALYWVSRSHIDDEINTEIEHEIIKLQQIFNTSGSLQLINHIATLLRHKDHIYYLQSAEGEKLAGNLGYWPEEVDIEFSGLAQGSWVEDEALPTGFQEDDAYLPVAAIKFSDGSRLLLARNVEQASYLLEMSEFLLEAMGITILFTVFIAVILGRQILRRMDIIGASASEIMAGDMSQRVPVSHNNDEFDTLAKRLNAMLDRIQKLIKGLRDVTDNIAHDLRSPLTRMRNQMEVTLLEPRSPEEYQKVLRHNINEIETLIRTFNALLSIAQTEAGHHRAQLSRINLKQLALDLMDLYTPLSQSKGQSLVLINGDDSFIFGSRDLLAQSFGNLLENAIKYTPRGGEIKLHIKASANQVEVIVADSGPGIAETEKDHVLEKFVRLESARNTPGNGLGLSLVAAVAGLHNAELVLKDSKPGESNPGLQVIQRFSKA